MPVAVPPPDGDDPAVRAEPSSSAEPPPDPLDEARPPEPGDRPPPFDPSAADTQDLSDDMDADCPDPAPAPWPPPSSRSATTREAPGIAAEPCPPEPPAEQAGQPPTLGVLLRATIADHLPPALRGGRVDPGRRGALALAAVAAVAVGIVVVLFLRSRPQPVAAPAAAGSPRPTARSEHAAGHKVTVDVAGKVRRPGLVTLPAGARVADAVKAAGGPTKPSAVGQLNLARAVTDGEQILVGVRPVGGTGGAGGSSGGAGTGVSLNQATESQFEELPDVGPVLAQRIVDYRTEHGSFTSSEQRRQVSGIGEKTYADLKDKVRL